MEVELFITALFADKFVIVDDAEVMVAKEVVPVNDGLEEIERFPVMVALVKVAFVLTRLVTFPVSIFEVEALVVEA